MTRAEAQTAIDQKTKPPGSLGQLEGIAVKLAEIQGTLTPRVTKKRICVFAADHGIAAEGVSAFPPEVTEQMVLNFANGGAAINVLAREAGAELHIIDVGVANSSEFPPPVINAKVRQGTRSFLQEPAMTLDELSQALKTGRDQAAQAKEDGIDLLAIGEMGIANTTSATALYCGLLNLCPEDITGRGTGIDNQTLQRKTEVIQQALAKYSGGWLTNVGGLEIAAMAGTILGASEHRIPIVVDGFIASAAAAAAFDISPESKEVCLFAHQSSERGHQTVLKKMGVQPMLNLDLRLGEGTGAALAIPIISAAAAIMRDMATFKAAGVSQSEIPSSS